MPTIRSEIIIHGDCSSIFDFSQDYNVRLKWDPFLKEACLLDGVEEANVGALAWCVSKLEIGMETRYVTFQRPHVAAIKTTKGPKTIKDFAGSWVFREVGKQTTKVTFHYYFSSIVRLLDPIVSFYFRIEMKRRLRELKRKYEDFYIP